MLARWQRYVIRHILAAIGIVVLLLIGLQVFILFTQELHSIGKGDYDLWQAFIVVLLQLPAQIYLFFPIACLLGSLLGLGSLATHCELTVMRAAGISIAQIAITVVKAALVLIVCIALLGEFVAPQASHLATVRRAIAKSNHQAITTKKGIWLREGRDFIHIQQVLGDHQLQGITRYRFDSQQRLIAVNHAATAQFANHAWQVKRIKTTYFYPDHTQVKKDDTAIWKLKLNPNLFAITDVLPADMSARALRTYVAAEHANGAAAKFYELAFWQRLLQPLVTCLMMLLALPFIFGPLRSVPMGTRFLVGTFVGFGFYMANRIIAPMSIVIHLSPLWAALLPVLICAGLVTVLLART